MVRLTPARWRPRSERCTGELYGFVGQHLHAAARCSLLWAVLPRVRHLRLEKTRVPLIGTSVFSLISTLLNLEAGKPLVPAALRVCTVPLSHGRLGKVCNRVVAYYLQQFLGNAGAVANILFELPAKRSFLMPGPMGPGPGIPWPRWTSCYPCSCPQGPTWLHVRNGKVYGSRWRAKRKYRWNIGPILQIKRSTSILFTHYLSILLRVWCLNLLRLLRRNFLISSWVQQRSPVNFAPTAVAKRQRRVGRLTMIYLQ